LPDFRSPFLGRRRAGHHHRGLGIGITDGAAAVVVASRDWAEMRGLTPRARVIGWATAASIRG